MLLTPPPVMSLHRKETVGPKSGHVFGSSCQFLQPAEGTEENIKLSHKINSAQFLDNGKLYWTKQSVSSANIFKLKRESRREG